MKKLLIISCFFFATLTVNGQNSKLELYLAVDNTSLSSNLTTISKIKPALHFNFGVNYLFKNNFFIKPMIGFRYLSSGYKTELAVKDQRWPNQVVNGMHDPTIAPPADAKPLILEKDYPFVQFPIGVRLVTNGPKMKFYTDLAVAPQFLIKKYTNILPNNFKNNLAFNVSIGMDYQLSENTSLFLRPSFSIQILNINGKDSTIKNRFYRYGIEFGMSKSL